MVADDDPEGHYRTLGIDPEASGETIAAAFRAAARRVHPDVPGTGDATQFMRVRAAYDVLADPRRRAAYDRAALDRTARPLAEPDAAERDEGIEDDLDPMQEAAELEIPAMPWPRPTGLAAGLWAGGAAVALLALAIGLGGLGRSRPPPAARSLGRAAPPAAAPSTPQSPPTALPTAPPPLPTSEASNGYVLPAGDAATLWRRGSGDSRYLPAGQLAPFTSLVTAPEPIPGGMVAVRTADGRDGFVYADRVAPGDAAAAMKARCIYEAGPPPANNEILARRGTGRAAIAVQNLRDQPVVLKMRDASGASAASVFISPRATVTLDHLPAGDYRPEFAFGELWSHGCGRFMAGMRPQRFTDFERLDEIGAARYRLPPDDAVDETDDEFNRE